MGIQTEYFTRMESLKKFFIRQHRNINNRIQHRVLKRSKNVIIIGGGGEFGMKVVEPFSKTWRVMNIDSRVNKDCHENLNLNFLESQTKVESDIENIRQVISTWRKFDAMIYCHDLPEINNSMSNPEIFDNYPKLDKMYLKPAYLMAQLASRSLMDDGVIIFPGFKSTVDLPNEYCF